MADVTAEMVKALRERSGAGIMDCKQALAESKGNMEEAIEWLRKKGLKNVGKRAARVASEGCVGVYTHPGDQVVALVELNSETDFVARGEDFKQLAKDIALHVAAMKPQYASVEDVPAEILEKEKEIAISQLNEKQRANADKILPGKLAKFYEDCVLMKQPFVRDDSGSKTIEQLVQDYSAKCGEKVVVRRFVRFEVGEGIAKAESNLADDVAATIAGAA